VYYVSDIAPSIDGGYFVVGSFREYDGLMTSGIVKIHADGTVDNTFNVGGSGFDTLTSYLPYKIEQQPDGKIMVAGSFSKYNGVSVHRMIRLFPDGELDNTFYVPFTGTSIRDFVTLPDSSMVVCGKFGYTFAGITKNNIERINIDGSVDSLFHVAGVGTNVGTFTILHALELTADGKILIGGNFTSVNGSSALRIARMNINGSIDPTFVSSVTSGTVLDLAIRDANVYFVGEYTVMAGNSACFGVLNINGSANLTFPYYYARYTILDMAFDASDKILIGGIFSEFGNRVEHCFMRLNEDGIIDETGNGHNGANSPVYDIEVSDDGSSFIGGEFTIYDKYPCNRFAKLHYDGTFDTTFEMGTGFDNIVRFIREKNDGKLVVAGDFTAYNGITKNHVVQLLPDGSVDPLFSVGSGPNTYTTTTFRDIDVMSDGKIVISGIFSSFGGAATTNIVRLFTNGTPDISFAPASVGSVYGTAVQPDGKVIVYGGFTTAGGLAKKGICRLNSNGSIDATFNSGAGGTSVYDCALLPDGKLIIAGTFVTFDGVSTPRVARLLENGSIDTSFHIGLGASGSVDFVRLLPDGKLLLTGYFTSFNGVVAEHVVVLNPDGSVYLPFAEALGTGFTSNPEIVTLQNDGDFLVSDGGIFQNYYYDEICRIKYTGCENIYDTIYAEINEGEVYMLPDDVVVSVSGTYTSYVSAGFDCDSVITTILTVIPLPCLTPGGIVVSNITPTTARVSWTAAAGASQYNLWYRVSGVGGWTKKNVTVTTKKLTGLSANTTYEYKLRTKCGATYSPFSVIGSFTTLPMKEGVFDQTIDLHLYPNPGHDIFTIEMPDDENDGKIYVLDITGKCVFQVVTQPASTITIDLSTCASGIYLVKYISDNYTGSTNLVKQ
jgi:uncharacterized delta-60 repeat protein